MAVCLWPLPGYHSSKSIAAFDPKPFITSFEGLVDQLISLRKNVQLQTERMEKSVRVTEREYSKKMAALSKEFEVCQSLWPVRIADLDKSVGTAFSDMESRMNEVSSTAVRIGQHIHLLSPSSHWHR